MRKILGFLVVVLVSFSANAQNDYYGEGKFSQVINGDGFLRPDGTGFARAGSGSSGPGKNIIKVKLDGLMNKKIGLGYERVLTEKITIGVDGLYQLPSNEGSSDLLSLDAIYDQVVGQYPDLDSLIKNEFPSGNYGLTGADISRFYVMPEVRLYFKEAPKGFYAGLYFKYRQYSYTNQFEYNNDDLAQYHKYNVEFNMNTMSGGLSLGVQTFATKNISLDLLFFGIQYSSNIGGLKLTTIGVPISNEIQSGVQSGLDIINDSFPWQVLRKKDINADIIDLESRFNAPSIRLPSLRLGIRF